MLREAEYTKHYLCLEPLNEYMLVGVELRLVRQSRLVVNGLHVVQHLAAVANHLS